MKIIVCVKQVPDTKEIQWTEQNTIIREGLESIINPNDAQALEHALRIKDKNPDTQITVLSMGPEQVSDLLRHAIAMGADDAILLTGSTFRGSDTIATAQALAFTIKNIVKNFDLIICGQIAIDGDTAQTPPSVAQNLSIPHATCVTDIKNIQNATITVLKDTEKTLETISIKLPALISVSNINGNVRKPLINGFINAQEADIKILSAENIGLESNKAGFKGSPTYVAKAFRPEIVRNTEIISFDNNSDYAKFLYNKVKEVQNEKS